MSNDYSAGLDALERGAPSNENRGRKDPIHLKPQPRIKPDDRGS